jgi:hypothetical protein
MGGAGSGQLGPHDDYTDMFLSPVQIASGVSRVWSSDYCSIFLKTDASLWGMGYAPNGQLGDRREFMKRVPVKLASGVVSAGVGGSQTLFLSIGPVISAQPGSVVVAAGETAPLTVAAFGYGPLSYQWFHGVSGDTSDAVAGAIGATFVPAAAAVPRNYWVRVSNEHADADSRTVVVAIDGSGPAGYQSWAAARGLSDLSLTADPDHDGLSNLIEYAFNTDPFASSGNQLPTAAVVEGSYLTMTFRYLLGSDVDYHVERSNNLGTWSAIEDEDVSYAVTDPDVDGDGTTELHCVFVPLIPGDSQGFLRLNIVPK